MKSQPLWLLFLLWGLAACATPPAEPAPVSVFIYAYNPALDTDSSGNIACTAAGLVALPRELPAGLPAEAHRLAALDLLLAGGLTAEETADGLTTEFPLAGLTLQALSLEGATLTLTFSDPEFQTSGGACRVSILRAQVEATARQFGDVTEIRILPDEAFQP